MNSPSKDIIVKTDQTEGHYIIVLSGLLNVNTCGQLWDQLIHPLSPNLKSIKLDVSRLSYCDMSGIALFLAIHTFANTHRQSFKISGLSKEMSSLFHRFSTEPAIFPSPEKGVRINFIEQTGRKTYLFFTQFVQSFIDHIVFVGELVNAFVQGLLHPSQIRWKDVWIVAEKAGVNALPIVSLIAFLMGLILAFQSVVPMSKFGAEIFVADLIGLSMIRELGPLMTAIVLAGRTGSAFAAELGAMKVNEEIDALTTMGLDPINFLVVVRVMAALIVTPFLSIFADVISVIGGAIPLVSMGYPVITYYNGVVKAVDCIDLLSGLYKSLFFGLLVASAGCMCGLQTKTGAGAVGESTTRAVVNSIILIVVCDGIFSVIFYYLGV